ncbi:MAG: Tad domain-containing protein [Anaerolineae bacterium]|nr:Tad domain-containing protein [Anaerolineae bacterium]
MLTLHEEKERGQSIIVIAFIVIMLLALVAVVVDVGNAYAQRRVAQNAVDSAAMAGVRELAEGLIAGNDQFFGVTDNQVLQAIEDYAEINSLDPNAVVAWYIDADGQHLRQVGTTPGSLVPRKLVDANGVLQKVEGVAVKGDLPFNTYFAHLIGFPTMTASAPAEAWVMAGMCNGDHLFPVTIITSSFDTEPGGVPVIGKIYTMWEHELLAPGNFGWLYWVDGDGVVRGSPPQNANVPVLEQNILDTTRSGYWAVGDWVHGNPGVNFQPALAELECRINNENCPPGVTLIPTVTIPLYNDISGGGNNTIFKIGSFGEFRLVCARSSKTHYVERQPGDCTACQDFPSDVKCIRGYFVRWVVPSMTGGCSDTGIYAPSFRKP